MFSRKLSLWVLALTYILMLWVASSFLSRRHGFVFIIPGLLALLFSIRAFLNGRRSLLYTLYLGTVLVTITALGTEFVLYNFPGILKGEAANIVYSGYYWQRGGIYIPDHHLGNAMRPDFRRRMYWQNHTWTHETNADGYRGPRLSHADAVFLGDSMVYGHGLEQSQTVPEQFSQQTDLTAANLAQQGTCLLQAAMLLEDKGFRLKPRYVFLCSHPTDLDDLTFWYEGDELQKFLTNDAYRPLVREQFRPKSLWNLPYLWSAYLAVPLRSSGVAGALSKTLRAPSSNTPVKETANYVPSKADLDLPFAPVKPEASAENQLRWKVHRQAILRISRLSREHGAQLVLYDIGYPTEYTEAIEGLAKSVNVPFSPAGRVVLTKALAGEPMYLANDGHWTPQGSEVVARELRKFVR